MRDYLELFATFSKLGLFTFGGGYAMLPLLESEIVEKKKWATYDEMCIRDRIKDIQILTQTRLDDPIYLTKVKEVLGHKWIEVFGGIILGLIIAGLMYFIR